VLHPFDIRQWINGDSVDISGFLLAMIEKAFN
jgi:hypothetical protein